MQNEFNLFVGLSNFKFLGFMKIMKFYVAAIPPTWIPLLSHTPFRCHIVSACGNSTAAKTAAVGLGKSPVLPCVEPKEIDLCILKRLKLLKYI